MEPDSEVSERSAGIRAVDRVCDILDVLARSPQGSNLTQIARSCGMAKGSVHRYLLALEARRYVERVKGGATYRLGLGLIALQANHVEQVIARARPLLTRLRDETGETTNLGILDGDRISYLEIVESAASMRVAARHGDKDYLHCTAIGKVLAAELDADDLASRLGTGPLLARTDRTITNLHDLFDELRTVKLQGYAVDDCENESGGRCVAVKVPGDVPVAVSVSAPAARLPMESVPDVAEVLRKVADQISE